MFYLEERHTSCYEVRTFRNDTSDNRYDARAEHRPALTWEGEVNGTAVLILQGDRVDVDTRSADLVSQNQLSLHHTLTGDSGRIEVENRQGGGRVRVIEQPVETTTLLRLSRCLTSSRGPNSCRLDFYWDDERSISRDNGRYRDDSYRGRTRDYGTRSRTDDRIASFCRNCPLVGRC